MNKFKLTDLLIFVVTAELTGAVSALISGDFTSFYAEIKQPPLSPPAWIFPVVWAILYALMGISAYMVWNTNKKKKDRAFALKVYFAQLAVNFSWSIIFFRFRLLGAAAVTAIILMLLVVLMILAFSRVRKFAAKLNIPYLIWLLFASYLAAATYIIN
ncbi:MAG: tryptophan-rich sensory protein [Ruminococcus sp.]|uniref:TspO/MBR family protein n=1 Tax=Ruminococcus sp. TaxID=41978 RepID=UPI0025F3EB2B|nr:TspO/MBR family protein [Ruminococcus sp.]MCR5601098.1 tryptophan-rich sensory protein [Ruminococcus sp.]